MWCLHFCGVEHLSVIRSKVVSFDQFEHNYVTSMSGAGQKVHKNEAGTTFHVTILRTKSSGQMVYVEAGKDLVDVLLSFLVLPVGTIIRMLNAEGVKERKFGAMDNIYKSVEKLQESMLCVRKTLLTEPRPEGAAFRGAAMLQVEATPTTFQICSNCYRWVPNDTFRCSFCRESYVRTLDVVASRAGPQPGLVSNPIEGYSKESARYIVGNNLEIMPTSTINCMDVLSKMKVLNLSDLQSIDQDICRKDGAAKYLWRSVTLIAIRTKGSYVLIAPGVKARKFGAIDNIFKSVENHQESMLYVNRTLLTEPRPPIAEFRGPGVLLLEAAGQINEEPALRQTYQICSGCYDSVGSNQSQFRCRCGSLSRRNAVFVPSTAAQPALQNKPREGYVKKNVTYIVSNNLEIMPTSSIKSIDVLNKMKVQNLSDLFSIEQEIGRSDVLNILLAAISGSETPLMDVFGGKVK